MAFIMRISPSVIPGKETSIDRCNANIETQLSASEILRKAMSFTELPFFNRTRFMIAKVIFVKVYAAMVIITIICMTLPLSRTTDRMTVPTSGRESSISIAPVKRIKKTLFCRVLKMANLIRLRIA